MNPLQFLEKLLLCDRQEISYETRLSPELLQNNIEAKRMAIVSNPVNELVVRTSNLNNRK